jgi:thiol-disulfide isomerase/thioredoxin
MMTGCEQTAPSSSAQATQETDGAPTSDVPAVETTEQPSNAAPVAASPQTQVSAVEVKILNYDAIQKLIASHKGKVVVMDAWSTSCEPCVEEFPNLVALHKKYGPDKVACISLSFDYEGIGKPEDVVPAVKDFLIKQGATFDNVVSSDDSEALYKKMKLASVPAVYVYNQQGELAKRFDNEQIEKEEDAFNYQHIGKLVAELIVGQ